ncbi:hypothetical protein [Gordonia sp. HS-NH1]|uniref:hypothetical protein n=1 Tax=Gordonia sp. HS-NH1 TaxID=1435068 RepID=UPI000A4260C5|nr:hypothetical protein [Gordonia sp. HS-NH1]
MILVCNDLYRPDALSGTAAFALTEGHRYTCVAHAVVNESSRFLTVDDHGVIGWIDGRYFDTIEVIRPLPLSSAWGVAAEHFANDWWRVSIAHRSLLPLMDRLDDGFIVGDPDLVASVKFAVRTESARDAIVLRLARFEGGYYGWTELSSWALDQLNESSSKAFWIFSDEQTMVLAEISARVDAPTDTETFVEGLFPRL